MAISRMPEGAEAEAEGSPAETPSKKTKIVVVGLGMVGVAFM